MFFVVIVVIKADPTRPISEVAVFMFVFMFVFVGLQWQGVEEMAKVCRSPEG